jgi:MSHA pilin protein MshC
MHKIKVHNSLPKDPSAHQGGFTLVELVTVMILISILAVSALPRFIGSSSYSAYSLRNEFLAELRAVQALALNNTDRCYRIGVTPSQYQVSHFTARTAPTCAGAVSRIDDAQLLTGGARLVLLNNGSDSFNIDFDVNGRVQLNCAANNDCLQTVADETLIIGISPEGYVYGK